MKTTRALIILGLVLLPVLAACEPKDKDLVLSFAKEWGKEHGLFDEKGSPTKMAIARGIAPNWLKPDMKDENGNVDEAGNAAVDAGAVVKSMVDNDKIALEAMEAVRNRNNYEALKKINFVVSARPKYWYYLNRRAVVYAAQGNDAKSSADFKAAEGLCNGSQRCLDAVHKDQGALLEGKF